MLIVHRNTGRVLLCRPGVSLVGADLSNAPLAWGDLAGIDLHRACLAFADCLGADFHGADLSAADLLCADLAGADLHGADLSYGRLQDVDLCGADLRAARLEGAMLAGALYDSFTRWPDGFDPGPAGALNADPEAAQTGPIDMAAETRTGATTFTATAADAREVMRSLAEEVRSLLESTGSATPPDLRRRS